MKVHSSFPIFSETAMVAIGGRDMFRPNFLCLTFSSHPLQCLQAHPSRPPLRLRRLGAGDLGGDHAAAPLKAPQHVRGDRGRSTQETFTTTMDRKFRCAIRMVSFTFDCTLFTMAFSPPKGKLCPIFFLDAKLALFRNITCTFSEYNVHNVYNSDLHCTLKCLMSYLPTSLPLRCSS